MVVVLVFFSSIIFLIGFPMIRHTLRDMIVRGMPSPLPVLLHHFLDLQVQVEAVPGSEAPMPEDRHRYWHRPHIFSPCRLLPPWPLGNRCLYGLNLKPDGVLIIDVPVFVPATLGPLFCLCKLECIMADHYRENLNCKFGSEIGFFLFYQHLLVME